MAQGCMGVLVCIRKGVRAPAGDDLRLSVLVSEGWRSFRLVLPSPKAAMA